MALTLQQQAPKTSQGSPEAPLSLIARVQRATFAPNIDAKGRRVRLAGGIACLTAGSLLLLAWVLPTGNPWLAGLAALAIAVGVFMLFEARASFCVLRALGFRTRW